MADDTAPAPVTPYDPEAIQRALAALGLNPPAQAPTPTEGGPGTKGVAGFLSDVGTVLGGGPTGLLGLSPDEQAAAGRHDLLNFGINMLAASGKSYAPKDFGTVLAAGLHGAQSAQQESENRAYVGRGASQALAQQAYENRLKAIKEALPLLQMQQRAGQPNPFAATTPGSGAPNTSISAAAAVPAYGGAVNAPPMPAEYEQHFQDASKATGVPVAVLKAVATQESGFNPDAKNGGIMQITAGTAKNPGIPGMQGVDNPDTLRDPRSNIMFGAQYLAGLAKKLGVDLNTPEGQAAALKAYNGGGDKEYVAHVFRYMPPGGGGGGGTQVAATKPPAAAPAAATPPGRVQVATADTGTKTDATPAPAATTTAQAEAPPPPFPGYMPFADWRAKNPSTIDPALYTVPGPSAEAVTDAQREKTAASQALANARATPGADETKAIERYTTASQNLAKLQQDAQAKSVELRGKAQEAADTRDRQLYDAEMERLKGISEGDKGRESQIKIKEIEGRNQIAENDNATRNVARNEIAKPVLARADAAQQILRNANDLEFFAKAGGDANALWDTEAGKRLSNWFVTVAPDSAMGRAARARQSWDTMVNGMFGDVHVNGMGSQSDMETEMLRKQWGSSSQTPLDRLTTLAIIRKNAEARIKDGTDVSTLMEDPKSKVSDIHRMRQTRKVFDRPPVAAWPIIPGDVEAATASTKLYNDRHPVGEPYVTWAPKADGSRVLKWARNTGDPQKPIELLPGVDVRQ